MSGKCSGTLSITDGITIIRYQVWSSYNYLNKLYKIISEQSTWIKPRELQYIKLKDATFADIIIPQINNGPTITNNMKSNGFPPFSYSNSISLPILKPLPSPTIPISIPHPSSLIPSTIPLPPHPPKHLLSSANRRVDTGRQFNQIPRFVQHKYQSYKMWFMLMSSLLSL